VRSRSAGFHSHDGKRIALFACPVFSGMAGSAAGVMPELIRHPEVCPMILLHLDVSVVLE
jgi:hypothetical protein